MRSVLVRRLVIYLSAQVLMFMFLLCFTQLHMLGDGSRGAILEMTLAKVLYISSKSSTKHWILCLFTLLPKVWCKDVLNRKHTDHRNECDSGQRSWSPEFPGSWELHQWLQTCRYFFNRFNALLNDWVRDAVYEVTSQCCCFAGPAEGVRETERHYIWSRS